jgi:hypothetical protein
MTNDEIPKHERMTKDKARMDDPQRWGNEGWLPAFGLWVSGFGFHSDLGTSAFVIAHITDQGFDLFTGPQK